jgi:hypothetical protein
MPTDTVVTVFAERLRAIESLSSEVVGLMSTLAYYADTESHDALLLKALTRLGSPTTKSGGFPLLASLQRYHATLSLYAAGTASIAAERPDAVATALATVAGRDETTTEPLGIGWWLAPSSVIDEAALKNAVPDLANRQTAVSDYMYDTLREELSPLIRDQDDLEGFFDDFEYLMGLAYLEASDGRWAPAGRFIWRQTMYPHRGPIEGVVDRFEEQLLAAGIANGDRDTLVELRSRYAETLNRRAW